MCKLGVGSFRLGLSLNKSHGSLRERAQRKTNFVEMACLLSARPSVSVSVFALWGGAHEPTPSKIERVHPFDVLKSVFSPSDMNGYLAASARGPCSAMFLYHYTPKKLCDND